MKKILYIIIFTSVFILINSCECSFTSSKIADVKICTSLNGNLCNQDINIIDPSANTIYASCILKYAPENTNVKFTWYYYGDTKIEIDNVVLNSGTNIGNIDLFSSLSRPNRGWPKGVYEITIEIIGDNSTPIIKQFNIQ